MLTRRSILGAALGMAAGRGTATALAGLPKPAPPKVLAGPFSLEKRWDFAVFEAYSQDFREVCVVWDRYPITTYVSRGGRSNAPAPMKGGNPQAIWEFGTWRELCRGSIVRIPASISMIPGSRRYVYAWALGQAQEHLILDCETGRVRGLNGLVRFENLYWPVREWLLAGLRGEKNRAVEWLLFDAREDRVVRRAPFSPHPSMQQDPQNDFHAGSHNGEILCHVCGPEWLVCRRAVDFSVLWTKRLRTEIPVRRLAVSPDGQFIAVAYLGAYQGVIPTKYWVDVLWVEDGSELTRLPARGEDRLGVSAGGGLVGVTKRTWLNEATSDLQTDVEVYETKSGKLLGAVMHERWRIGRGQYPAAGLDSRSGLMFVPDGYLVTSGLHTRVWKMGI